MVTFFTRRYHSVVAWLATTIYRVRSARSVAVALVTILVAQTAFATDHVRFVDDGASSGGDGIGWSTAYRVLQDAIADADAITTEFESDSVEIRVAAGTYYPDRFNDSTTGNGSPSSSFELHPRVTMKGGYSGSGTTRDPSVYITYLDGDLGTDRSYHVVTASESGIEVVNCVLDGFTIQNGNANGSTSSQKSGGGIYINAVSPKISNCVFTGNDADANGAGAWCFDTATAPEFRNCEFISNAMSHASVDDTHGAGLATNYSVTIINCVFKGNSCYNGGGLAVAFDIEDLPLREAEVNVINCKFEQNIAAYGGGAVLLALGEINFVNCLFNANTGSPWGGAIWMNVPDGANFTNCTFVHNSTNNAGGAWYVYSSSDDVQGYNCLFFDNVPDDVSFNPQAVTLTNCALEQNLSGASTLVNCIRFGYNGVSSDPGFVDNSNTSDPSLNDYHLTCNSPPQLFAGYLGAVNWDTFNVDEDPYDGVGEEYTPDLDKNHRVVGAVDMGCYEKQKSSPCSSPLAADITPMPCTDGLVNIDDLLLVINSWGPCESVAMFCPGDIVVNSYNQIDVDDLLAVINSWSNYCVGTSYNAGSLSSVEDCMDAATNENLEPYSPEWDEFVDKCVQGLCEAQIIDCD